MNVIGLVYSLGALWVFAVGAVVGSFANVCIYRIPWQKSVIWPASHCPRCLTPIAGRDNFPLLSWLLLSGRCRTCKEPIAARYPLIEALVGLLFVGVYLTDVVFNRERMLDLTQFSRLSYHAILVAFLVVATFIDYDLYIIPDEVTVPGMLIGLLWGTLDPSVRPEPSLATTHWAGFLVGLKGLLIGGATIWVVRIVGRIIARREAMGFGDVTLMAMVGSFLGWQLIPAALFLGAILGVIREFGRVLDILWRWLTRKSSGIYHEIPFGPYLSMASLILLVSWPRTWPLLDGLYGQVAQIPQAVRFLLTGDPGLD